MAKSNVLTRAKKKQAESLLRDNRLPEAKELYRRICQIDKRDAESWFMLGMVNVQLGLLDEVVECCRQAISIQADHAEAHLYLGNALHYQGRLEDAIASFRRVLELDPDSPEVHNNLGNVFAAQNKFEEAEASYRKAILGMPGSADVYNNLGGTLLRQGKLDEAIASYREALRIKQYSAADMHDVIAFKAYSNLLYAMNFSAAVTPSELSAAHKRWPEIFRKIFIAPPAHTPAPDAERRLRIGYVSPDFREHSVAYFIEPLLSGHNGAAFETFCYADVAVPDAATARLQGVAHHWRSIYGMNDLQVVERVRADRIDILVDLAGHTAGNRLRMFVLKPAPVQVSYLGYPATTGVPAMDYRLTDEWADPPGLTEPLYTETLVRLAPIFLCYRPPRDAPDVGPLPSEAVGHVTFGSFNNLAKMTPPVISLWSSILKAVPGSRLILKNHALADAAIRERFYALFQKHDVPRDQVELLGILPSTAEHLALYGRIDIGLDTFPYHGTTTTCEAMWMGVPVVTLEGMAHAGRVGVSLLHNTGLPELIAKTPDDYIRLAVHLANDRKSLASLRSGLRHRVAASPLCDGKTFAHRVEAAYRDMWRKSVKGSPIVA